jgi:hypothetical protein
MLQNITQQQLVDFLIKKQQKLQDEIPDFNGIPFVDLMKNYEKKANYKAERLIRRIHPLLEPAVQEYISTGKAPDFEYKNYSIKKIQEIENHEDFFLAAMHLSEYIEDPEEGEKTILEEPFEFMHVPPYFVFGTSKERDEWYKENFGEEIFEEMEKNDYENAKIEMKKWSKEKLIEVINDDDTPSDFVEDCKQELKIRK